MQYSLTIHSEYQRVYIYSLNKVIYVAKDVVLTGAIILKLASALSSKG